ncbi:MAG TPA: D-2-hydroxyacid dehydrogenase [Bryobacteraceae bacterium]|nr:D-2-hydroxyacid dehydrogenase [Bryobacteraceae bacterium]
MTDNITVLVLADPAAPPLRKLDGIGPGVTLKIGKTADALGDAVKDARVLFNWSGSKPEVRRILETAPKLEWIHAMFAGLDRSLFPELVASPVPLTNGRGVFSQSLGEFVMLGILYFAKDVGRMMKSRAEHRWDVYDKVEIRKQTLGIVAHGDIGRAVAWRAKAMGMRVLAQRKNPAPRAGDEHVDRVYGVEGLPDMLAECDYVAVTAPLTPETTGMIGKREFELMKPSAVILNVGRGPVIDEIAMVDALRTRRIRGAALDVFNVEPLPADSPFWDLDNVLLSSHCADHVEGWVEDAVVFFVEQFEEWRRGEPLRNVVDKHAGY